jgi:hypothetical protein
MIQDVRRPEPDPVILYYCRVLPLIPLHVAHNLVFQLREVLFHAHIESAQLFLDVLSGKLSGVLHGA